MMSEQEQIETIAILDGWEKPKENSSLWTANNSTKWADKDHLPRYTFSRDAIVPVIERQTYRVKYHVSSELNSMMVNSHLDFPFLSSPQQLCEALLRATGNWKTTPCPTTPPFTGSHPGDYE